MESHLLGAKVMEVLAPRRPRRNLVISLLTVGQGGHPNVCLLSPFQVVAVDKRTILLAVYEGSKTSSNLEGHRQASLVLFLPPAAFYIKGSVSPVSGSRKSFDAPGNALHRMAVERVTKDYYARAPITSAVTFEEGRVLSDYSRVFDSLVKAARGSP